MEENLFPAEVTSGVPFITMTGNTLIRIEQHNGLIGCRPDEIMISTSCGCYVINGENLYLKRYSTSEVFVAGRISAVSIRQEGGMV